MMKPLHLFALPLTLLLAITTGCFNDGSWAPPMPGTLDLTIVDGSSTPVSGIGQANVLVFDATSGDPVGNLTSDNNGRINEKADAGSYQLRISANGFSSSPPPGIPPIPLQIVSNQTTSVTITLYPLDNADSLGTISGTVSDTSGNGIAGALVVAEIGATSIATTSAGDGSYLLHNVPAGDASLTAFIGGFNFAVIDPVTVTAGATSTDQNIAAESLATGIINGSISFTATTAAVVDVTLLHPGSREVIPGMRTFIDVNAGNSYEMTDIPNGHFEIIASLENDGYVLDPDTAVTQGIPTVDINADTVTKSFKVTGAIELDTPATPVGNIIPELSSIPSFEWHQASSYSNVSEYVVEVVDESGSTIWGGFDSVTGLPNLTVAKSDPVSIGYNSDGTATLATLEEGRYYQLRIYASKDDNTAPLGFKLISATETLDGIFKVEL